MNLTTFQNEIKWVTRLDEEPDVYAEHGALYVDFYATVDTVSKVAPDVVCVDLYDGDSWIAWEDAKIIDPDTLQRFRWIVSVD